MQMAREFSSDLRNKHVAREGGKLQSGPHALLGLVMTFSNDLGEIRSFFWVMVSSSTFLPKRNDKALCSGKKG